MRSVPWMFVALLGLAQAASTEVPFKTAADDGWCDDRGWGSSRARHCEVREATWPATGDTIAVDSQPNGGIEVVGWDRNEIRLRVKVAAEGATLAEAKSRVAAVQVATDGVIRAKAPNGAWASFRLEVPRESTLSLESNNGGLHLSHLSGIVEARTENGGVHLEGMGGKVLARTTNGGVHVRLAGESWDGESLDVETSNGGIHLQIPDDYNAHLKTSTVNGGIHAPEALRRQFNGKRLDVDLGRGGAPIRIATQNGGLHLN